jgi:hypothetical protein
MTAKTKFSAGKRGEDADAPTGCGVVAAASERPLPKSPAITGRRRLRIASSLEVLRVCAAMFARSKYQGFGLRVASSVPQNAGSKIAFGALRVFRAKTNLQRSQKTHPLSHHCCHSAVDHHKATDGWRGRRARGQAAQVRHSVNNLPFSLLTLDPKP